MPILNRTDDELVGTGLQTTSAIFRRKTRRDSTGLVLLLIPRECFDPTFRVNPDPPPGGGAERSHLGVGQLES